MPVYDQYYPVFVKAIGREDLTEHPVYSKVQAMSDQKKSPEMYDIIWERMLTKTAAEWTEIFTKADIPFSLAQTWEEVAEDKQAWEVDVFTKVKFESGAERVMVRPPVSLADTPLPEYKAYPLTGADNASVLRELGYTDAQIKEMEEKKEITTWKLDERGNPIK
jgi:cinnamoyl-CoA:phenyllactate CoA-transferase